MGNNRLTPMLLALLIAPAALAIAGTKPEYRYNCGRTPGGGAWWIVATFEDGRITKCWGADTDEVLFRATPVFDDAPALPTGATTFAAIDNSQTPWYGMVASVNGVPALAAGVDGDHKGWTAGFSIQRGRKFLDSIPKREMKELISAASFLRDVAFMDPSRKKGKGVVTLDIDADSINHRMVLKRFEPSTPAEGDLRQLPSPTETGPKLGEMRTSTDATRQDAPSIKALEDDLLRHLAETTDPVDRENLVKIIEQLRKEEAREGLK